MCVFPIQSFLGQCRPEDPPSLIPCSWYSGKERRKLRERSCVSPSSGQPRHEIEGSIGAASLRVLLVPNTMQRQP